MRAWTNGRATLVGRGNPLSAGAYLDPPARSPQGGAWALVSRAAGGPGLCAEDGAVTTARMQWDVYSEDEHAAELAAAALASQVETLTGLPQPCGDALGTVLLVHDNLAGPVFTPMPTDGGEPFCFQVQADLVLTQT